MTWTEAVQKAFEDLNGRGTELDIYNIIESKKYRTFENSDTPRRSLNLYLNRNFKGKAIKKDNHWILLDFQSESINETNESLYIVNNLKANTVKGILALEEKAKTLTPDEKSRVSSYIERGSIANKIKFFTDYKCLICDALKLNPHCFLKINGVYYIEAHHVQQVSNKTKGVLSIKNLITVCPNHHRQLHYGNSTLIKSDEEYFIFKIDGEIIKVKKIEIKD